MTIPAEDFLTGAGATALAERIRHYWKRRGHLVRVWIEEEVGARELARGSDVRGAIFAVRSNLLDGLPREKSGWSVKDNLKKAA